MRMDLDEALHHHFGLEHFRPLQREVISEVLAGRPVMTILPTGGGKSLCYQLPALLLPGATLIISPLISLMKDQVDGLVAKGIRAIAINSQDTAAESRQKLDALATGEAKLVFVAPERLRNPAFLEACRRTRISLLAVDEAHCVSQWGHDFRPDYRYIQDFHAQIGSPPLLALTATARRSVQEDIRVQLGMQGARVFSAGSDRPNLWLGVHHCRTVAERQAAIAYLARETPGSIIVYVTSRKDAESYAARLTQELAEPVVPYHAGLEPDERTAVQNRFMAGLCRIVVATNAFGMGIDKADIRAVIHAGVPDSLEAYFQEVGRAGRDGLPSICTMVLVPGMDVKLREGLLLRERADGTDLAPLLRRLQVLSQHGESLLETNPANAALALLVASHLQEMGHLEVRQRTPDGLEVEIRQTITESACQEVRRRLANHERQRQERFRRVRQFVYLTDGCRREYLLQYFNETLAQRPAACCSTCHPRPLPADLQLSTTATPRKRERAAAAPASREAPPANQALLEHLKRWRRAKAAEMQVPAFVVFGDKDLAGIAAAVPRTLDELAACRGIGPTKLKQYGTELLDQIAALPAPASTHTETIPEANRESTPETIPDRTAQMAQAEALFAAGQAVAAVAEQLDEEETWIWSCFLDWLARDQSGAWQSLVRHILSPNDYKAIRQPLQADAAANLQSLFSHLGGRYSYRQIQVARAVWLKTRNA